MTPSWWVLGGALLLDWAWGEMPRSIHPVVLMGKPIRWVKSVGLGRRLSSRPYCQFFFGLTWAIILPSFFALVAYLILASAQSSFAMAEVLSVFLLKSTFACRALGQASWVVRDHLRDHFDAKGDLNAARFALRSLCSRDASSLGEAQLVSATVASVAENLSDSVVAPIIFYLLWGVPGAVFYRVVNTMDAVLGYRGPLEYLGKAPARLDDLLNWLPARITAIGLVLAAPPGLWWRATQVVWQDRRKTPSPNGGWPMAAMAGNLGIPIIKVGVYQLGEFHADGEPELRHIDEAWSLAQRAIWILLCLAFIGGALIHGT